jgi:hypothetical protein
MENKEAQNVAIPKTVIIKGVFIVATFLLIVFGIWHFSSGIREDISKRKGATTTGETLFSKKKPEARETLELSYYNNWIKFIPGASIKETYPEKEFVEVDVVQKNLSGADATKWVLVNSRGEEAALGSVSNLPLSGKVNATEPLKIKAGDRLFISTGRSPIGVSFRVNKCSVYLEQFQDFVPPISGECPQLSSFYSLDGKCQNFIQNMARCEANTRPIPPDMTGACKTVVSAINYNSCVTAHKNDPDFYLKEWRIFLGKEKELWVQPKDTVTLLDDKRKLIDTFKY